MVTTEIGVSCTTCPYLRLTNSASIGGKAMNELA